jgi:hypothetical protein
MATSPPRPIAVHYFVPHRARDHSREANDPQHPAHERTKRPLFLNRQSQKLLTQLGLKPNVQGCVGFVFHGAHIATPPQHAATHSTNSMACMEETCSASAAAGPQIWGLAVRLP